MNDTEKTVPPRIWTWPILIAVISTFGLISALLGDGVWNVFSWISLGIPVAIAAVALFRKTARSSAIR